MSDLGYNIWGVVTGTLGLLGLLPFVWLFSRLPSRKFRALQNLMQETEETFRKGLDEGLHTGEDELYQFHSSILACKLCIDDLRSAVRTLKSWPAELRGWWTGLSSKIEFLHGEVSELHAKLIESSSRDRKRLAAEGYANGLARLSGARSQKRRSSILSYANQHCQSTMSAEVCASQAPTGGYAYPRPRRPDSPLPLPSHDALHHLRSTSPQPHICSLPESETLATFDVDPEPVPSVCLAQARYRGWRAMRRDMLYDFGRQLSIPDAVPDRCSQGPPPERKGDGRSRLKTTSGTSSNSGDLERGVVVWVGNLRFVLLGNGLALYEECDGKDDGNI